MCCSAVVRLDALAELPTHLCFSQRRRVRILWEEEATWYAGVVKEFDSVLDAHVVLYDDGEVEVRQYPCGRCPTLAERRCRGLRGGRRFGEAREGGGGVWRHVVEGRWLSRQLACGLAEAHC